MGFFPFNIYPKTICESAGKFPIFIFYVEVFNSAVSRPLICQLSPFLLFHWWKEQTRTPLFLCEHNNFRKNISEGDGSENCIRTTQGLYQAVNPNLEATLLHVNWGVIYPKNSCKIIGPVSISPCSSIKDPLKRPPKNFRCNSVPGHNH